MKKPYKYNFLAPIHLACSTDILKPVMNEVAFLKGSAIATDGHMLVRQKLKPIHGLTDEDIATLEGKRIHRLVFAEILKYNHIKVLHDGIEVNIMGSPVKFGYADNSRPWIKWEDAVINTAKDREPLTEIGFNANFVTTLNKILRSSFGHLNFNFTKKNRAIFVGVNEYSIQDQFALLMPVMLSDFDSDYTGKKNLDTLTD